jgi:hypothetical protein
MEFLNRIQVEALAEGTKLLIRWDTKKSDGEVEHTVRVTNGKRYVGPVNLSDFMPWPEVRLAPTER